MDQVTLSATSRSEGGTRPSRRLRREGFVPAIVYGKGLDPVSVKVTSKDLYTVLHTEAGLNALINLDVEGSTVLTVAREVQRHPVRGNITHLDFIKVSLDEVIQADVGIDYLGIPLGVIEDGGIVEEIETSVLIRALPTEVPASIELDISELRLGDTVKLGDLPDIEGVEYVDDAERTLLTILVPRKVEEEEVDEEIEGEEFLEGEEDGEEEAASEDAGEE